MLERILGRNDLIDIRFFHRMHQAAKAVCRVQLADGGAGTGWLLSPRLLITNNHVLPSARVAADAAVEFAVDTREDGGRRFKLDPSRFFSTSREEELDYTVVAVREADEPDLAAFGYLLTAPALVPTLALGEPLNIIQHPDGEHKQYAIRENELIAAPPNFLHYRTDTNPGSSGSPVFNNQWQVVALHHSGVPRRVNGRIVNRQGKPWTPDMGDKAIDWIANEGVRIDAILRDLRERASGAERDLLGDLGKFAEIADLHVDTRPPPRSDDTIAVSAPDPSQPAASRLAAPGVVASPRTVAVSATGDGLTSIVIPLHIQLSVGAPQYAAPASPAPAPRALAPRETGLREALERLDRITADNYYDRAQDEAERDRYYQDIDPEADGGSLHDALSDLLRRTHERVLSYKEARLQYLYPIVDLVRDGRQLFLRSLYSADEYHDTREFVREEFAATERFEAAREALRTREAGMSAEALARELDLLEASAGFNCEHVVPQSWFAKKSPMVADLHHLFTCDQRCNSRRGNFPLTDFADFPAEDDRERCGVQRERRFEPRHGKAAAARATLYFLVRYPGGIPSERYSRADIGTLKRWSIATPPDEWERRRNAEIARVQGVRNPFIDYPEWVARVDFSRGLGS
jgi:V8-like Glu-specific endopeptidase